MLLRSIFRFTFILLMLTACDDLPETDSSNKSLASVGPSSQQDVPVLSRPSPPLVMLDTISNTPIEVSYGAPSVRGRTIYGELVPYNELWRTGANNATTLQFNDAMMLEGHEIPAGKYSLYTIPGEKDWTIILNKQFAWGTQYEESQDFLRFKVEAQENPVTYETFTIELGSLTNNGGEISLKWENTVVAMDLTMDVDSKVSAQIDRFMEDPTRGLAGTYYQSASYYFNTGKDLEKALEWVNQSLEYNPNPYWVIRLKSQILAGLKEYKKAIDAAEESKEKAQIAGNADYVRLNEKAIKEWKEMM